MSPRRPPAEQRAEIKFAKATPPPNPFGPTQPPAAVTPPAKTRGVKPVPSLDLRAETKNPDSAQLPTVEANVQDTPPTAPDAAPPAESPEEVADAAEESRPGLGPMIKAKKSKGDLAGTLWKAASAAAAFKPRPGGAGERLRELAKKASNEPDGITGVVPAPPRATPVPEPTPTPTPPTEPAKTTESNDHLLPEVKVTVPNSSRPTSLQAATNEAKRKSVEPRKEDKSEPLKVTGNDAKYFATLGVDTSFLADSAYQFAGWLDHFGWVPGEKMRSRNFDDMKIDLDRELNKAQAGGWVARFQEEDERVDAIKKGLDVAIAECEELDNLLTLYSVELSVSGNT